MNKKKKFLGVLIFIAVFAAVTAIVMLLWNALIPSVVGWQAINYWQAAGLMILCRLLFGGFGHFGRGHFFDACKHPGRKAFHEMKREMREMSQDERREFIREHMRNRHPYGNDFFDHNGNHPSEDNRK